MRMKQRLFFAVSDAKVLTYAAEELEKRGISVVEAPSADVTHLLLPVPCKMEKERMEAVLRQLPRDITVLGGGLNREELSGYCCVDLLTDERYLAENAMITADCAIRVASNQLPITWQQCPVLILGWGRIGKCLGQLLKALGAEVSIAARKEADRAMIRALGCESEGISGLDCILKRYRVIFNTVPHLILSQEQLANCRRDCIKIELASSPGMAGEGILPARGLPGRMVPESSGRLIARTVLRLCARKEGLM
jgi:dipicolinate synthase subunit A